MKNCVLTASLFNKHYSSSIENDPQPRWSLMSNEAETEVEADRESDEEEEELEGGLEHGWYGPVRCEE